MMLDAVPEDRFAKARAEAEAEGFELPHFMCGGGTFQTCPRCGFESLLVEPVTAVYSTHVEDNGYLVGCDRCQQPDETVSSDG